MKRALLLAPLVFCCARQSATPVDVPDDVAYVSVLEVGPDGTILEASAIAAWSPGGLLPAYASADADLRLVAWTSEQLGGGTDPTGARIQAVVSGCATRLPRPRFFAIVSPEGELVPKEPSEVPALSSPDVQICADPPAISVVVSSCRTCAPAVISQGGCRFRYDFGECGQGHTDVLAYADGGGCFLPPADGDAACSSSGPSANATDVAACIFSAFPLLQICSVSLFASPAGPPFDRYEFSFAEGPNHLPSYLRRFGKYGPSAVPTGYAHDLIVFERELVISTTGTTSFDSCEVALLPPGALQRRDLDGALISTTTVPACLGQLRGDPEGAGFVGTYYDAIGTWWLGRFERDGTPNGATPILPSDGQQLDWHSALPWMLDPLGANWFVVFGGVIVTNRLRTEDRIHVFDQTTLGARDDRAIGNLGVTSAIRGNALNLLVGGSLEAKLYVFDAGHLAEPAISMADIPIEATERGSDGVYDILLLEDSILVAASPPEAIYGFDRSAVFQFRDFMDNGRAKPVKFINLPDRKQLMVLGTRSGAGPGELESVVAFYDLVGRRFLPGVWPIGYGPVAAAGRDLTNRLFFLLPWAHKVVRLTLTDP